MKNRILHFLRDRTAVASIEYALLGLLISTVILLAVQYTGTQLLGIFNFVKDQVVQAMS
ncbi:Flp family type IVb pilin [Pseudoduganella sp. RAF53_2]|uniref:Flp family type IVb pilin n=1 Tax=unclassified Pseudoduganella TaxID=2637179 RepID=UPI003F9CD832